MTPAEMATIREANERVLKRADRIKISPEQLEEVARQQAEERLRTALSAPPPQWPHLSEAALYGLPGQIVAALDPHTEADSAALLFAFLAMFGAAIGPGPKAWADGAEHPARLFVVLVGQTSKARKDTATRLIRRIFKLGDPEFDERILTGLGSGEALIDAVDEREGIAHDPRALVHEAEFYRVLAVARREGSTLSAVLRLAWDDGELRVMTRKEPRRARGAHIAFLGHVTTRGAPPGAG